MVEASQLVAMLYVVALTFAGRHSADVGGRDEQEWWSMAAQLRQERTEGGHSGWGVDGNSE